MSARLGLGSPEDCFFYNRIQESPANKGLGRGDYSVWGLKQGLAQHQDRDTRGKKSMEEQQSSSSAENYHAGLGRALCPAFEIHSEANTSMNDDDQESRNLSFTIKKKMVVWWKTELGLSGLWKQALMKIQILNVEERRQAEQDHKQAGRDRNKGNEHWGRETVWPRHPALS